MNNEFSSFGHHSLSEWGLKRSSVHKTPQILKHLMESSDVDQIARNHSKLRNQFNKIQYIRKDSHQEFRKTTRERVASFGVKDIPNGQSLEEKPILKFSKLNHHKLCSQAKQKCQQQQIQVSNINSNKNNRAQQGNQGVKQLQSLTSFTKTIEENEKTDETFNLTHLQLNKTSTLRGIINTARTSNNNIYTSIDDKNSINRSSSLHSAHASSSKNNITQANNIIDSSNLIQNNALKQHSSQDPSQILRKVQSPGSKLISSQEVERILQLRKEQKRQQPQENFYMQMLCTSTLSQPKYDKSIGKLSLDNVMNRIKTDDQIIEQFNGTFTTNNSMNKLPVCTQSNNQSVILDDGSILEIGKVRANSDNVRKNQKLKLHNSQNINFKKADERSDAKMLSEWLDEMLATIYKGQIASYKELYYKLETVFNSVVSELSRQLSVTCSERAQLLNKVWSLYCSFVTEVVDQSQKTNLKIENDSCSRIQHTHQSYLKDIGVMHEQLSSMQESLENKENYMNKLKSENRYLRKKWKKLEKGTEIYRTDMEQLLTEREELVKENEILKLKIEGILVAHQIEQVDKQFDLNESQERFKDEVERVRNELFKHFSDLFNEQKAILDETYSKRQDLKEKEILLAQKIEEEDMAYEKSRLNVPHVDQDAFYDMVLANKGVDTRDLIKITSVGVDTSNLITHCNVETQITPIVATTASKLVQATVRVSSVDCQADFKSIVKSFGTREEQEDIIFQLNKINHNFDTFVKQHDVICSQISATINSNNSSVLQPVNSPSEIFQKGMKSILQGIALKDEFSQNDVNAVFKYIEENMKSCENMIAKYKLDEEQSRHLSTDIQIAKDQADMEVVMQKVRVQSYHILLQSGSSHLKNISSNELIQVQQSEGNRRKSLFCIDQIYHHKQTSQSHKLILKDEHSSNQLNISKDQLSSINDNKIEQKLPSIAENSIYLQGSQDSKVVESDISSESEINSIRSRTNSILSEISVNHKKYKEGDEIKMQQNLNKKEDQLLAIQIKPSSRKHTSINLSPQHLNSLIPISLDYAMHIEVKVSPSTPQKRNSSCSFVQRTDQSTLSPQCNMNSTGDKVKIKSLNLLNIQMNEDQEAQSRRRFSIMEQITESARAENSSSQRNINSTPSQRQKLLNKQSTHSSEVPQIFTLGKMLRQVGVIQKIQNVFNRLRIQRNSGESIKEATLIVEKLRQEGIKPTDNILNKEQKLSNLLKTFSSILVELFKFVKKNQHLNVPHFHAFVFDYFINRFGYNKATERKFEQTIKTLFELRHQHKRLNFYHKLLVGEMDCLDYKFLIELLQKVDETNSNGIGVATQLSQEKAYLGWNKTYEFFLQFFGSNLSIKQLDAFDKQLQQFKCKSNQNNKIQLLADESIQLLMSIYNTEIKLKSVNSYSELYEVVDVFSNQFLQIEEFLFLIELIEPQESRMKVSQLVKIFCSESDIQIEESSHNPFIQNLFQLQSYIDNKQKLEFQNRNKSNIGRLVQMCLNDLQLDQTKIYGLSLERFSEICIDYGLLSPLKQIQFSGIQMDSSKLLEQLQQITIKFMKASSYSLSFHLIIERIKLTLLNEEAKQVKSPQSCYSTPKSMPQQFNKEVETSAITDPKPVLLFGCSNYSSLKQAMISFHLVDKLSNKYLIESIVESQILPSSFNDIQFCYSNRQKPIKKLIKQK